MGGGKSKVGSGGGGAKVSPAPNSNPLISRYINALNNMSHRITNNDRKDLAAAIATTTDVGDKFVFTGDSGEVIEFVKRGPSDWRDTRWPSHQMTASSMRDTLLYMENGKWAFKPVQG